jgi:hypothetical protein
MVRAKRNGIQTEKIVKVTENMFQTSKVASSKELLSFLEGD